MCICINYKMQIENSNTAATVTLQIYTRPSHGKSLEGAPPTVEMTSEIRREISALKLKHEQSAQTRYQITSST